VITFCIGTNLIEWHHKTVTRLLFFTYHLVLGLVLLVPRVSFGHSIRPPAAKPSHVVPPDASSQEISRLLGAQKAALQTGDPAAIEASTRSLISKLLRERAKLFLIRGKQTEPIELYRRSLKLQDSPEVRLELASILLRTGHPQEAEAEVAHVLQTEPRNASAWAVQGSALRSLGKEREAADAFSHSLEIKPEVNVAYAFGSALLANHEKEKADRIFRQIISASGNAAIWHVAAGDAYREALYLTDAVEEFKKAITLDPAIGHAQFFLGLTYLQMNEWGPSSQSFEHLRAAVRLAPHEYLSNFYLGALESTDGSDLASSDRHLQVAAHANPNSPEVWLYLGLNAGREKNTAAAKAYLRKAIDLTGTDEARNNYQIRRVYAVLGRILISEGDHVQGNALLARYKSTEQLSIGNSAQAITQSAGTDDARSALSGIAASKTSYPGMKTSEPLKALDATAGPPNSAAAPRTPEENTQLTIAEQRVGELLASSYNDLGTAEARQGEYQLALGDFQEAEHWSTPTPALLHNLGAAAFRTGDFGESARALGLFFQSEGNSARDPAQDDRSHMMLAMSLFSLGRFAEADKAFGAVPALSSQDSRAAYSWAYSLAHSGQQQHANQIADTLVQQDLPSDVMSLVCHLYMDTENYERSAACFRKAYQADPNLKLAHYQVAESLIRLDRPAEAIPELKQELALSPDNPDVRYSLAFALLQSSHKAEAIDLLKELTSSNPTHAQAQYQLGKALLEDGQTLEAVKHLEGAEQSDPSPDYIHYQLQAAYRKAGRIEDADRELRLYKDIKSRSREVTLPH